MNDILKRDFIIRKDLEISCNQKELSRLLKDISTELNREFTFYEFHEKCKSDKPEILEDISKSGKLEEDTENLLVETIKELKQNFNS